MIWFFISLIGVYVYVWCNGYLFISFIRLKMTQIMSENINMFGGIIKDLSPVIIPLALIFFFAKFIR